jgi:hypothetical protein
MQMDQETWSHRYPKRTLDRLRKLQWSQVVPDCACKRKASWPSGAHAIAGIVVTARPNAPTATPLPLRAAPYPAPPATRR